MRKIIRSVASGRNKSLHDMGLSNVIIKNIYIITNELLLYSSYDSHTGTRIKTDINNITLTNNNVSFEDRGIDWKIINDKLFFSGHNCEYDDYYDLLIEYDFIT
jgi:hypothetical protein